MPRRRQPPPVDYVTRTRELPVNLLFVMPWLVLYQLCLLASKCPVDNAAGAWVKTLFSTLGREGLVLVGLSVVAILLLAVAVRFRQAQHDRGVVAGMMLEGLLYGAVLGSVAKVLASRLPLGRMVVLAPSAQLESLRSTVERLGLAIGAGVFEELVFRGLLLVGVFTLLRHAVGTDRWSAGLVAILASAWLFSGYHHWGPGGEPYDGAVFAFRFWAGAALGAVFLTRGFGIAAFAHGFYDALVMLGQ